ncbi:unnamed protein product [Cylindrotheca closterium]|uniref:Uncharacterized protein n=1 Tax=Cylindrotheca closterium TaxID=2856 RepID=A0AAD2FYV9_9STRA|nr:unnamed protein product [Cylindrotheca closterium]
MADRFQIPSSQTEENADPRQQPIEVDPPEVAQRTTIPQVQAATETPVPDVPNREPATVTQQDDDDQSVDLVASSEETDEMVTPDSVDTYLKYIAGDDNNMCLFDSIIGHKFWEGELYLKVQWRTNDVSIRDNKIIIISETLIVRMLLYGHSIAGEIFGCKGQVLWSARRGEFGALIVPRTLGSVQKGGGGGGREDSPEAMALSPQRATIVLALLSK